MQKKVRIRQNNPDCLKLIQITDTHLFSKAEDRFDGFDTMASLRSVIAHINALAEPPDLVLVTGDLAHDPVASAYQQLLGQLTSLKVPVFCLPGNHDDPALMEEMLNHENVSTVKVLETLHWTVLLLNSFLPHSHSGRLAEEELDFLSRQLQHARDKHLFICLHHPPIPVNSPWMDAMMLENPDDFFAIVDRCRHTRGILWGHIHQEFSSVHGNVLLLASPSTCVQFTPLTDKYIRDNKAPGYRTLGLQTNGSIKTVVHRVAVT
ncbi:MAG: 3',5'-cyclic-AMP phosphodiesterase [Gammaproteobacteria bacterium]